MSKQLALGESAVESGVPVRGERFARLAGLWHSDTLRRFRRHRAAQVGAIFLLIALAMALGSPVLAPYGPQDLDLRATLHPPSSQHWFGTDQLGRDVFSRVLYGGRISLLIGIISVGVGALLGVPIGAISGFRGGWTDRVIMRIIDVLFSFPTLLLALIVVTVFGQGLTNAMLAIGIAQMPIYARLMRGGVLQVREFEYVEAARAVGQTERRILWRHILPNTIAPIIVQSTLQAASAILSAAYLGFLGLGAEPGTPEWGTMLSDGRDVLRLAPHVTIFPGLAIVFTVLAFNLVGDGLRDALEPRLAHR